MSYRQAADSAVHLENEKDRALLTIWRNSEKEMIKKKYYAI